MTNLTKAELKALQQPVKSRVQTAQDVDSLVTHILGQPLTNAVANTITERRAHSLAAITLRTADNLLDQPVVPNSHKSADPAP